MGVKTDLIFRATLFNKARDVVEVHYNLFYKMDYIYYIFLSAIAKHMILFRP